MKQVNTFVFAVLMFAAICLCIFSVANAAPANTTTNADTTIVNGNDTTCIRCEMTKGEFIVYLEHEGAIADPATSNLVQDFFFVTDNSWYKVSIETWEAFNRNIISVRRAIAAKIKYGNAVELDDILDLD